MRFQWLGYLCLFLFLVIRPQWIDAHQLESEKTSLFLALKAADIHPDDLALIEANIDHLSVEQLAELQRFMVDSSVIADSKWFDISEYTNWNDYNYKRPIGDTILGILARRDLFLDPARQLNNRALTNMSPEALAALAFSQVYVEEKWDHEVPWDGDPNRLFNWIHPALIENPNLVHFRLGDYLYRERTASWWATYWSLPMWVAGKVGLSSGTDIDVALASMRPPNANLPRLAGYGYPLGNQLFLQTAETVYWYADYLKYGEKRYGPFEPHTLDTHIMFPADSAEIIRAAELTDHSSSTSSPEFTTYSGLWELFNSPFGADLRTELQQPETAAFWNVMRFLHAAARQREGGASPEHPENAQPLLFALRYEIRSPMPVGRPEQEVSAFALLTTVYSDSLLLDFTNWDVNQAALILAPSDASRSDGLNRQVSERNKAIRVVEQMGSENFYPNATHITGSRGLGFNLTNQYDDPVQGDFLPYTAEEARALVLALMVEARDYGIEDSRVTLCNSPMLRSGYETAINKEESEVGTTPDWTVLVSDLCPA